MAEFNDTQHILLEELNLYDDVSLNFPNNEPLLALKSTHDTRTLRPLDLILVGKTGHGKSSTANRILGKDSFQASNSVTSETCCVQYDVALFDNYVIKVVDTPGVADTKLVKDPVMASKLVMEQMKDAVILNPEGYHAFLLVYKFGTKYTKEELESIRLLTQIFGKDFVKKYCILIITGGDSFNLQVKDQSFTQWLNKQEGAFKILKKECNNRVILFDNVTDTESIRNKQMGELLKCVENLNTGSGKYTNKQFELAKKSRQHLLTESNVKIIGNELMDVEVILNMLIQGIHEIDSTSISRYVCEIDTFISRLIQAGDISDIQSQFKQLLVEINETLLEILRQKPKFADFMAQNDEKLKREAGRLVSLLSNFVENVEFKNYVVKEFEGDTVIKHLISYEVTLKNQQEQMYKDVKSKLEQFLKRLIKIRAKCDDYLKSNSFCNIF